MTEFEQVLRHYFRNQKSRMKLPLPSATRALVT
jgi:hypothetical protein